MDTLMWCSNKCIRVLSINKPIIQYTGQRKQNNSIVLWDVQTVKMTATIMQSKTQPLKKNVYCTCDKIKVKL